MRAFPGILSLLCALVAIAPAAGSEKSAPAHWSFQPLNRPAPPAGAPPIDGFIAAKLRAKGIAQNPPATRRELIRRAYFDLIGLPPSPEEIASFEQDESPDAFEKVLDRLLASPHYGERWGRHWLDLVRYAQSNGYERDGEKLLAWRYRDYVIDAFNKDKPYNRFILEQIAGDELPDGTAESVVATGFQRLGVFDDEPDDMRMAEFDALDDVLSTTSQTFLGLTVGCARCHDHKFDPIPQSDYYSLLAFFRGVTHFKSTAPNFDAPGYAPLAPPEEIKHWRAWKSSQIKTLEQKLAALTDAAARKEIEGAIKKIKEDVPYEWTLAVRESGSECPATHILARGNAATPRGEVLPAFPRCLTDRSPVFPEVSPGAPTSGRRRVLAEWIASAENPLTARVMVNRIWQHHFGEGLVQTTMDFGHAGSAPSHPKLLDWLAAEFVENGWSIKRLHKLIMTSATYRQSSRAENPSGMSIDPGNRLLWRQNLRRLEAEALRDSILAISGSLNNKMAGRGFFPSLAGEVLAGQSRPGLDWDITAPPEQSRRSVYAFIRRTMGVPWFETFDYNNTTSPLPERSSTTVAPQALMLLNDSFMHENAAAFAKRILRDAGTNQAAQIRRAYGVAFGRSPTASEQHTAQEFFERNQQAFAALTSRVTFRPNVPNAVSADYFDKLIPSQFLIGPVEGWSYHRGAWAPPYEGIRVATRDPAPFALLKGEKFKDGVIDINVALSLSTESASLFFRASTEKDKLRGYELMLVPRTRLVSLRKHDGVSTTIAQASAELPIATSIHVAIAVEGAHVSVRLFSDAKPILDLKDKNPITEAGEVGAGTWGGALSLDNIRITDFSAAAPRAVPGEHLHAERRALESFCLLLLNLNELLYID